MFRKVKSVLEAVRQIGISEAIYCKLQAKYANMTTSDAKHLKDLEIENGTLKRLGADLSLDNAILRDMNLENGNQTRQNEIVVTVWQAYSISERGLSGLGLSQQKSRISTHPFLNLVDPGKWVFRVFQ